MDCDADRRRRPVTVPAGWRSVASPRHPVLFVNPRSGGGKAARLQLAETARALGVTCVELRPGQDLAILVAEAIEAGTDVVGMAGGDGSLAVVATAAMAHGLPFVCVPAGTRNHFALDVGVERHDLTGSLAAFTDGVERVVDVGEVNGRVFLNNVSLGVYGDAVQRPGYRDAKTRTLLETAHGVLGPSGAAPPLRLVDDRGREHAAPAVLLVSNNPYALEPPFPRGTRPRLDTGRLGIAVLDAPDGPRPGAGYAWTATRLDLQPAGRLHAGIDGEPVTLPTAVHFASRPGALRVRVARRHAITRSA
jgi:diacylglycerol kinase family enzyme